MTMKARVGRAGVHAGLCAVLAACLGASFGDAGAWDAVYRDDAAKAAEFEPSAIAAAGNDRFWVAGLAGARGALARYDGNAAPSRLVVIDPVRLVAASRDGTPYTCNDIDGIQEVQRRNSDGELVWRRTLPTGANCLSLLPDGIGNLWVVFESSPGTVQLWRLASDGTLRGDGASLQASAGTPADYVVDTNGDRIVAVGTAPLGGERFQGTIAVRGPDGIEGSAGGAGIAQGSVAFHRVAITADDAAVAAGVAVLDSGARLLIVSRFGLDGTTGPTQVFSDTPILRVLGATAAPGNGAYIVASVLGDGGAEQMQVVRVDARSQRVFKLPVPDGIAPAAPVGVDLSSIDGGTSVTFVAGATSVTRNRLVAVTSSNTVVTQSFPENAVLRTPQYRADFSRLFVDERRNTQFPGNDSTLAVINADGTPGQAPPTVDVGDGGAVLLDAAFTDDGTSFLLTADASRRITLRRVNANATAGWSATRSGGGGKSFAFNGLLDTRAGLVCAGTVEFDALQFDCRNATQGTQVWSDRLAGSAQTLHALRLNGDGRLLVVYRAFTGQNGIVELHYRAYAANGALQFDAVSALGATPGVVATIGGGGNVLASYELDFFNSRRLVAFEPDGSIRYQRALPASMTYVTQVDLAPDGGALLLGGQNTGSILRGLAKTLDASGQELWTILLPDLPAAGGSVSFGASTITLALGSLPYPASGPGLTRALQVRRSDGSTVWQRDIEDTALWTDAAAFDFLRNRVLLATTPAVGRVRVLALDATNGTPLLDEIDDCEGTACGVWSVGIDADGKLRIAVTLDRQERRPSSRVFTIDTVAPSPAVDAGQAGVAGAWYAPAVAGQGFVVDWIAASRTLFIPWFTFADGIDNEAAALRWYTLQGNVPAGTGTAQLAIFENRNGAFADGSATSANHVGTATIRFEDCARAVLRYAFETGANAGRNGVIALQRLTPSAVTCQGTVAAAAAPKAVDSRLAGSWSEPARDGQGFAFAVTPGAGDGGAALFGAWFTYDPAGASDDDARQHWFTLQGQTSGSGDTVQTTIYRTLGGAFDARPTRNANRVGTATVTFTACDRARVEYRFDDAEIAAGFRARSGTLQLEKIGGCATP